MCVGVFEEVYPAAWFRPPPKKSRVILRCPSLSPPFDVECLIFVQCFHGHGGRAFLFERCANVSAGKPENRMLMTGMHVVADIKCTSCGAELGWKYVSIVVKNHSVVPCVETYAPFDSRHIPRSLLRKQYFLKPLICQEIYGRSTPSETPGKQQKMVKYLRAIEE